jgi:hypothetical protein
MKTLCMITSYVGLPVPQLLGKLIQPTAALASHQRTSRSGIWLGICPPPKPPYIEIVEPGIEGTMLESFDQGFELRRYCSEDDCGLALPTAAVGSMIGVRSKTQQRRR